MLLFCRRMEGIDIRPGLCQPLIWTLGDKARENPSQYGHVALMLGAMAIRKNISRDVKTRAMTGFVDLGDGSLSAVPATEALVVMVVGLTVHWKAPMEYYLTKGLPADTQAQLVTHVLEALNEVGVRTWSITMDGASANLAMCRELGCELSSGQSFFNQQRIPAIC